MKEAKSSFYQLKRYLPSKIERKQELYHSVKDTENLKQKIEEVYSSKYEEHFIVIINLTQVAFMSSLSKDINVVIKDIASADDLAFAPIRAIIKQQETLLEQKYTKDYKMISSAWNDYEMNAQALIKYSNQLSSKNNESFSFLKHYRKHCGQCETYASHFCNKKSKLLEITDENDVITYVICTECKAVYMASMIKLHCFSCECDYLSSSLSSDESVDILPATWEKYHCGSFINQTMKCIKCRDTLYINIKTNFLICINKACNFISKPNSIVWNCIVCKKDFYSNAKIFNPLDLELTKKAIRLSILLQRKAYPSEMNCCFEAKIKTNEDISKMNFIHKCNGVLFKGVLNSQDIIVCGQCRAMNFLDKFIWTCPLCKERFKTKEAVNAISCKNNSSTTVSVYTRKDFNMITNKEQKEDYTSPELTPMRHQNRKYKTLIELLDKRDNNSIKKPLQSSRFSTISEQFSLDYNTIENKQTNNSDAHDSNDKDKKKRDYVTKSNCSSSDNDNSDTMPQYLRTETTTFNTSLSQSKDSDLVRISKNSNIPPFCVEDYNILNSVGEGSFGKIYLIQSKKTQECFALKKIIAHDIEEVEKYQKEFELVYSVQHENIMKIFNIEYKLLDFCTYSLYVLMELADSDWSNEITASMSCKKYYKERELINILKQLTSSLSFLQKKSISHRDIKPQNVLIYKKNQKYKVADFGEAKEIKIVKIQQNTLKGTELYMSPLLYDGLRQNKAEINHNPYKSDVFSLGYCVLYAATLTLNVLTEIREIKDMKVMSSIVTKYLSGRYSDQLKALLIKMLEVEEAKRYDFMMLEREIEKMSC